MSETNAEDVLEGTTRRVFRFIFRQREPVGIHDVQRGLNLSSPSVAQYHIAKLLKAGLLKEDQGGYVADRTVFENMVRIRRSALPIQTGVATFFLAAVTVLLVALRPSPLTAEYIFALVVITVALGNSLLEVYESRKRPL